MTTLRSAMQCHGRGPQPGYATIHAMLDDIAGALKAQGLKPYAVHAESWPLSARSSRGDQDFLCRISIEADAGDMVEPLPTWFQWRHVDWRWSSEPMPPIRKVPAPEARAPEAPA